jgi:alkylation response protein AidB-like acyl-CoA dehydrogenase
VEQGYVDREVWRHERDTATGMAKCRTSELQCQVMDECLQLHGGYG